MKESGRVLWKRILLVVSLLVGALQTSQACTIFVLADGQHTLFCNNEDWSNPKTRMWFIPSDAHHGCVYVGFDDGWPQGGMNTDGLAFDWVSGYNEKWEPTPGMQPVRGSTGQKMLETCTNVDQAVQFYRTHQERSFSYAKLMVVDRTGASVIIGAKDGQLRWERMDRTRGFGFGAGILAQLLADAPRASVASGARILRACQQRGQNATKYSNVFDLRSGDLFLFPSPGQEAPVQLNLAAELARGAHYFDLPDILRQIAQPIKPLRGNMVVNPLDYYQPIPEREPKVLGRVQDLLRDALDGTMKAQDFSPELWQELKPQLAGIRTQGQSFGAQMSPPKLVDRETEDGHRGYRYRIEFQNVTLLIHFVFNNEDQVVVCDTEDMVALTP